MSKIAGQLLWNRVRIPTLLAGTQTRIPTGLCQKSLAFGTDPGLLARIMVIPMADMDKWSDVLHSEPYVHTDGTLCVDFVSADGVIDLNVLFWDPHSYVGPGLAADYGMIQR